MNLYELNLVKNLKHMVLILYLNSVPWYKIELTKALTAKCLIYKYNFLILFQILIQTQYSNTSSTPQVDSRLVTELMDTVDMEGVDSQVDLAFNSVKSATIFVLLYLTVDECMLLSYVL